MRVYVRDTQTNARSRTHTHGVLLLRFQPNQFTSCTDLTTTAAAIDAGPQQNTAQEIIVQKKKNINERSESVWVEGHGAYAKDAA